MLFAVDATQEGIKFQDTGKGLAPLMYCNTVTVPALVRLASRPYNRNKVPPLSGSLGSLLVCLGRSSIVKAARFLDGAEGLVHPEVPASVSKASSCGTKHEIRRVTRVWTPLQRGVVKQTPLNKRQWYAVL